MVVKAALHREPLPNNRIEFPWLANGIGIYGGRDHSATGNTVTGTVLSGGGILISSGHGALPFGGTIRATDNTFVATGGDCYIGEPVGVLWLHAGGLKQGKRYIPGELMKQGMAVVAVDYRLSPAAKVAAHPLLLKFVEKITRQDF